MNITREQYEADIRAAKSQALSDAAEGITRDVEAKQSGDAPNPLSWQTGALWVRDRLRMGASVLGDQ